jgi:hypothetical protein
MTYDLPPTSSGYGQQAGNGGVRDQARNLGSEAAQAGGNVAQTAKEEGRQVVHEASRQARNLYSEARTQLAGQASDQQRRATGGLRSLADEMRSMAEHGDRSGPVSELARQAADRVQNVAGWLENREPGDLIAELRNYARRNPGTFLVGAALLGVVAGRLTRGVVAASNDGPSGSTTVGDYRSAYSQPVTDPDSTVVLPPTQPSGFADALPGQSGYAGTTQPAGYAGTTQPAGYADTTQPLGYADTADSTRRAEYADTTQPAGYAETESTGYTAAGEPGVYGEPRSPIDETEPLPGTPSRGARP